MSANWVSYALYNNFRSFPTRSAFSGTFNIPASLGMFLEVGCANWL